MSRMDDARPLLEEADKEMAKKAESKGANVVRLE